jgi:hypothetical protein
MIGIAYRVQHTAGRDEPLARLLARVPPAVEIITDHDVGDPNPWRNYMRCLSDLPEASSHVVVLQDDVVPCRDFGMRVRDAVRNMPHEIISLFVGGLKDAERIYYREARNGRQFADMHGARIHHVVGIVWPVAAARAFMEWYAENEEKIPSRRPHRSDDMVFSYWIKNGRPRRKVWATIPSLVEHPDDVPQVARQRQRVSDRGRRAIQFAGE